MDGMLPIDPRKMSHADLYRLRALAGADQGMLAPMEHRAFAREFAQEQPVRAAVSLPFAIPAYTAAKAAGLTKARSPASADEMVEGFKGLGEGLFNYLRGRRKAAPPSRRLTPSVGVRG